MTLKVILQKNIFLQNVDMYIMNTIKIKKINCKFCFASKIDLVWSYLSQNMGLFQPREVQIQMKKREKVL